MLTSRWEPMWNRLAQLQNEMNRLFDRWGDDGGWRGTQAYPAVNLWEDGDNLILEAELPGLDLKDLEIYVTGQNQLTIKGERKPVVPAKSVQHRQERAFGSFNRVLTLPHHVDPNKVEAQFEHGVLRVKLAKHESAKPRKIPVKAQ